MEGAHLYHRYGVTLAALNTVKPTAKKSTSTSPCKKVALKIFLLNQLQIFHGAAEWNPRVFHMLGATSSPSYAVLTPPFFDNLKMKMKQSKWLICGSSPTE